MQNWIRSVALSLLAVSSSFAGRFEQYSEKFANTPDQAKVAGATLFGGAGTEWFAGGGIQPDGTIVAAGTCLGPTLEAPVPVTVIGKDKPGPAAPVQETKQDKGKAKNIPFSWKHPNATGFVVRYSSDLRTVKSVTRMPWSSGAITSAAVAADGSVYIAGPATDAIATISPDARALPVQDNGAKKWACEVTYIARLSPAADKVLWVRTMKGPSACPTVRISKAGKIMFQGADLRTFTPAGAVESTYTVPGGLEGHVAVNPVDGTYARGGEHHWATGREPWRCPTLNIHKPDGELLYQLYDWGGPYVGMDNIRQVSDSAIRGVTYDDEGNLVIHAWSDGGNSVMHSHPNDVRRDHGAFNRSLGMEIWGAGVLSAAYILKIETKNYKVTDGTRWLAFVPNSGKPNSIWIDAFDFATDGSVCIAGRSASGLIRTANQIGGGPPAGPYAAVIGKGLNSLRFCSSLPACGKTEVCGDEEWGIARGTVNGRPMALFFSGAEPQESIYEETLSPAVTTAGTKHGGGFTDAHLLVLDLGPKQ